MPYPADNYEGRPQPGTTFSQRRAEMDQLRFVAIRNMAYLHYTNQPDPSKPATPLMTYNESLGMDRDDVKKIVLQFELQNGLIQPDGTEAAFFAAPTASAQPQGAQMTAPGYSPAPGYQPAATAPTPGGYPPGPPAVGIPPPPSPAAAAAAAGYPSQPPQYAPPPGPPAAAPPPPAGPPAAAGPVAGEPPPAPRGRKRAAPQGGAGVAPPPGAPPPAPQPGFQQPQTMAPPPAYAPPPAPASVGYTGPAVPPPNAPQASSPGFDPTVILQAIDRLGGGLSSTSKVVDGLQGQIAELKSLLTGVIMVQQWQIGVDPGQQLVNWLKQNNFEVTQAPVTEFIKLLVSRIPR